MPRTPRDDPPPVDPANNRFIQTDPMIELGPDEVYVPVPLAELLADRPASKSRRTPRP